MVTSSKFVCQATGKQFYLRGHLNCESKNIIYIISCKKCKDQYVRSAINFKNRFRVHKSDIKTNKDRCGTAQHFNDKCCDSVNPHIYLQVQLIEQIVGSDCIEDRLWDREKYWQSQLFTTTHGMNSPLDLYSRQRKGCRIK